MRFRLQIVDSFSVVNRPKVSVFIRGIRVPRILKGDAVFEVESVLIASVKGVSVYLVVFLLNHLIAKKTKSAFVDF